MTIIVNGKETSAPEDCTLTTLFTELDLDIQKMVIELNGEILSKDRLNETNLKKNDILEIIHFVGGG